MTLSIQIISDLIALGRVSADWDNFLKVHGDNPFLYTNFLFQVISSNPERIPLFLILRCNKKIIGLAPLHLTSKFGVRFAEFFFKA
jgi:CelD/BcsL family acetyltransferase involved in cellulose biosynthesis